MGAASCGFCLEAMDPAAVEEFRKLEQEKNRLEAEIKTLYEYLTEDGCWANLGTENAENRDVHRCSYCR